MPSIGENSPDERRNLAGWLLFGALAVLMIGSQLASYLSRTPNVEIMRKEIEDELRTKIAAESLPGAKPIVGTLKSADAQLQKKMGTDPETTLLYAAVRTEEHQPIDAAKLGPLRISKDEGYQAAYRIYTSPTLSPSTAASLSKEIPATTFLNKLVAAQASDKAGDPGPRKALAGDSGGSSMAVVAGSLATLLLLGLGLIFAYLVARSAGKLEPKGLALGNLSLPDADRVALRSAQMLVGFLGAAILVALIVPRSVADIAGYVAAAAIVIYLASVPVGGKLISWRSLGVTRDDLGKHILWGVGGAVANLPIIALVTYLSNSVFSSLPAPEHPVTVDLTHDASPWVVVKFLVIASVFVPIIEETMFRGTLFPAVSRAVKSPIWGGIVTSLVFAAIHPTGIPAWPGLAAIGGMSCFLAYQTKSLVPSIAMHAVHNFGVLVFTVLLLK